VISRSVLPRSSGGSGAVQATLALLVSCIFVGQLPAQEPADLEGQVVRYGEPVSDLRVTLHRVTSEGSGEIAFTNSDFAGRFRFPLDRVEGAAFTVFFVTADFQSVRYFGPPLHPDAPREAYTVEVFDTTSVLPQPARIARRDLVMLPETGGSWEVNEIITISNPSTVALVSRTGMPTWEFQIPAEATDFLAGEGDILPHEINMMDNRILLLTPLIPGDRELYIRYRLPASSAGSTVPIGEPTDTFNLYVQQPSHLTAVIGMQTTRMIEAEGEQFLQYGATGLLAGSNIQLRWARTGPPVSPVLAAISLTLFLLGIGVVVAWRSRSRSAFA